MKAELSSYDLEAVVRSVEEDINAGHVGVVVTKGATPKIADKYNVGIRSSHTGSPSLKHTLERMLNNAFNEGCKCGKGGFSPY